MVITRKGFKNVLPIRNKRPLPYAADSMFFYNFPRCFFTPSHFWCHFVAFWLMGTINYSKRKHQRFCKAQKGCWKPYPCILVQINPEKLPLLGLVLVNHQNELGAWTIWVPSTWIKSNSQILEPVKHSTAPLAIFGRPEQPANTHKPLVDHNKQFRGCTKIRTETTQTWYIRIPVFLQAYIKFPINPSATTANAHNYKHKRKREGSVS